MLNSQLRLALRVLLRRRLFTAISLFGTGFTLMVLLIVAALADNLVAPMTPETRIDRTLFLERVVLAGPKRQSSGGLGYALLDKCARDLPGVERTSFYTPAATLITYHDGERLRFDRIFTDGAYWDILQFNFLEGGPLTEADNAGGEPVAVISAAARRRYFGDDGPAVGRTIELDRKGYRVKGVVENVAPSRRAAAGDVWLPLSSLPGELWRTELRGSFNAMLLAADARSFPAIRAEYRARLARLELPPNEPFKTARGEAVNRLQYVTCQLLDAPSDKPAPVARFLALLGVAALAFMALPAINLVNLNLSRMVERSSEIGVRKAFGASAQALVGQFLVENVVLSLIGGVLGLVGTLIFFALLNDSGALHGGALQLHARLGLYGLGLSLFFGVLSGVYPAWRMARLEPVAALKGLPR